MSTTIVLIEVKGGNIQRIVTNSENVSVMVRDFDLESTEPEHTKGFNDFEYGIEIKTNGGISFERRRAELRSNK